MVSIATDAMNALRRALADRGGDADLRSLLLRFPDLGDDELADLIELDARERLRAGLPVELPRYLDAIPDLPQRQVALDAAIEFALRSLSGSRHTKIEAVESLCAAYPDLVPAISAAWFLNDALGSTTGASMLVQQRTEIRLPMSIGPTLPDGKQRYELRERVGGGSYGSVYLAVDHALTEADRPAWVAIKLTEARTGSQAVARRVSEEATKARRVTHPNIARVLDRGVLENGGGEFIVYEHVDGGDLQDAHDRGRLPKGERALAGLVVKIARAVQAAHTAGLIHSDIKPSNVLLTSTGEPKVADFGLAARRFDLSDSAPGVQLGTLGFIAPERYRAEPGSEGVASDVYALGGVLYFLLTGKPPNGSTPDEVADRLGADSPPPASFEGAPRPVDPDLQAICRRALAPRAPDRYPSADAFANDLEAWIEHRPLAWLRPTPTHVAWLFAKRNPVVCAAAAAFLLGLFGVTVGYMQLSHATRMKLLRQDLDARKAIEQSQLESINQQRQAVVNMINVMSSQDDLKGDWLSYLTVSEAVTGPQLLRPSADGAGSRDFETIWNARLATARRLIAEAKTLGPAGESQAVLWQIGLGFWLLRSDQFAEARKELTAAADAWEARWGARDIITRDARMLAACAEIREIQKRLMERDVSDADRAALERSAELIKASLDSFTGSRAGINVHLEALGALGAAYSPKLLNKPSLRHEYELALEKMR